MTNKSDTPETDIVIGNVDSITPRPPQEELIYIKYSKMLHHARRLERELNALKAGPFTPLPTDEMPKDREWTDIEWMRNQRWMALDISEQDKNELAALKAENENWKKSCAIQADEKWRLLKENEALQQVLDEERRCVRRVIDA